MSTVFQTVQIAAIPTRIGKAIALAKEHNLSARSFIEDAELSYSGSYHVGFALQQNIHQESILIRGCVVRLDAVPW